MDEVMTMADVTANVQAASTPSSLPSNLPLFSAFLSFALAQFLKIFTTWCILRYKEKRWDSKRLLDSGGMPSSHSATVSALAFAICLQEGAGSPAFAVAVVLACIVMYDASGVRLHAGRQAELLNQIVCELPPEHPLSNVRPLRDSLGHTPLQVVAGGLLGCIIAFFMRKTN
ncbi:yuiD, partial [Mucuna pruriens]